MKTFAAIASIALLTLACRGQTTPVPQVTPLDALKPGIVVESVDKNYEGERAGLQEGDVLLRWSRGEVLGEIASPFDFLDLETEQEPRGTVKLEGLRNTEAKSWTPGQDRWRIDTRPNLQGKLLSLYQEGRGFARQENPEKTVERWKAAADEAQNSTEPWLSDWFLFRSAEFLAKARKWQQALDVYQKILQSDPSHIHNKDARISTIILLRQANIFQDLSDWEHADKCYQQAILKSRESGTASLAETAGLNGLGTDAWRRGEMEAAEKYYRQALELNQTLAPDSLAVATSFNNIGNVGLERDNYSQAADYYRQALSIRQRLVPGGRDVASSLNNLAIVSELQGNLAKAEQFYEQSLATKRELAPGTLSIATTLNNLGFLCQQRGDMDKSEKYNAEALTIQQQLFPNGLDVALSYRNLGNVAAYRQDLAKAQEYLLKALAIEEKLAPDSIEMAKSLNDLSIVYEDEGSLDKAEKGYLQSIAILEKLDSGNLSISESLMELGAIALQRKNPAEAEDKFVRALTVIRKVAPGTEWEAEALAQLGTAAADRGNLEKAEEYYHQALQIFDKVSSSAYADTLAALASVLQRENKIDSAIATYGEALNAMSNQVSRLGGGPEARSGFRATRLNYYDNYISLLITRNEIPEAFEVLEQSRAQTLLEMLVESGVNVHKGVDQNLLYQERSLREALEAKVARKLELFGDKSAEDQIAVFNREIEELHAQYQQVIGLIRESGTEYAHLTHPQPLSASQVQKDLLDPDTLLLEYMLGKEHSYLFAITADSLHSYELPQRSQIEDAARRVYSLLTARNHMLPGATAAQRHTGIAQNAKEYGQASAALSQLILTPVVNQLKKKRLLVVSDGALQYIPFGALPSPIKGTAETPLVAEHEIVNLPSASVLAELQREHAGRKQPLNAVAILADPVFTKDDSRIGNTSGEQKNSRAETRTVEQASASGDDAATLSADLLTRSVDDIGLRGHEGFSLPRLVFSGLEANSILAATPAGSSMKAIGFDANRTTATSPDLAQYRIVHFATHGLLDSQHPELSGLVLSMVDKSGKPQNGFLELQDIYNLNLPVDMVVLSACETGLGKEISGEGLVGLTRGFMYAGASRVVASLWKVDDLATAELMGRFYTAMFRDKLTPAAALREAQIEMSQTKRWADPYYWAAFELQGEWKALTQ